MNWSSPQDFNEAIQNAGTAFADPELKAGRVVVGTHGVPLPRSGNFADVYQVRTPDGREWAVKCFTRHVEGLGERYRKVTAVLARAKLPFTVPFAYQDEGIRVRGEWRPVVKMEWVDGLQLNQFVRENAGRPALLDSLTAAWVRMCRRLRDAGVAHADLQHGNILMVRGPKAGSVIIRLIDYDGLYATELANHPSGESGHAGFQHPERTAKRVYSPDLDRFPALVIATAMKGVAVLGPDLWGRYDTGDNMLFTGGDFKNPAGSAVLKELWKADEPGLHALVGHLAISCRRPLTQTPWLDEVAPEGVAKPLTAADARAAAEALGVATPAVRATTPSKPAAAKRHESPDASPFEAVTQAAEASKVEDRSGSKSGRRKAPARSKAPLLVVAALLVAGGAVAAALALGGKKSDQTAQAPPAGEPGNPDPEPGKGPKDAPPAAIPSEPAKVFAPPKREPTPAPPAVGIPVPPAGPGEVISLTPRWATKVQTRIEPGTIEFDRAGGAVVAASYSRPQYAAFRPSDGTVMKTPPPDGPTSALRAMTGGRIAAYSAGAMRVWDATTGEAAETVPIPALTGAGGAYAGISPDGRYVWAGNPTSFRLTDRTRNATAVELDAEGLAYFTADSARVLVAEFGGRYRWFKLPSGEPDGGWTFPAPQPGRPRCNFIAMSADGGVVLYSGPVGGREAGVATVDGKTGALIHAFGTRYFDRAGAVTADGRYVALVPQPQSKGRIDVRDARTGALVAEAKQGWDGAGEFALPAFSPDGRGLAALQTTSVVLYDVPADLGTGANRVAAAEPRKGPTPAAEAPQKKTPDAPPPAAAVVLKPKWSAPVPSDGANFEFVADPDNKLVLVFGPDRRSPNGALDLRTGKPRPGFVGLLADGVFRQTRPRVVTYKAGDAEYRVWDGKTGQPVAGKFLVPDVALPPGTKKHAFLSPNGRFLAVGANPQPFAAKVETGPLEVFDTTTNKRLLAVTWKGGNVLFTWDSTRALVAEREGRYRWFKLPSGEPDGGWDFNIRNSWYQPPSMSDDGAVVGYSGTGARSGIQPRLLDGKTGAETRTFTIADKYAFSPIQVSADGRRAAVVQRPDEQTRIVEVVDTETGNSVAKATVAFKNFGEAKYHLSPDGRTLLVHNSEDHKLSLYELPEPSGRTARTSPEVAPSVPKGNRTPVPADDRVAAAAAAVREILKEDYARKLPAERKALAQKLVGLAAQTTDDPAARYVMLRDAREFAVEVSDPAVAVQAIDALAQEYAVGPGKLKADALDKIAGGLTAPAQFRVVADLATPAADAAFDDDDLDSALRLAQLAAAAGRKAGQTGPVLEDADARVAQMKRVGDAFAAVRPALDELKTNPDDPAANLAVGKFRCFTQARWAEGIRLLAKGGDPAIKEIAELEGKVAGEAGQPDVKLADLWADFAQNAAGADKAAAEKRARYWYGRAAPTLTGLAKARAEGRMGFTANGVEYRPGLVAEFSAKVPAVLKGTKTRVDRGIDFSGGEFRDLNRQTDVTVRWSGVVVPPRPGRYRLVVTATDPVRVRLDGKVLIDTGAKGGKKEGPVFLADRPTPLAVEFTAPNTDSHTLKLAWVPAGGTDPEAIPPECLFHDRKAEGGGGK